MCSPNRIDRMNPDRRAVNPVLAWLLRDGVQTRVLRATCTPRESHSFTRVCEYMQHLTVSFQVVNCSVIPTFWGVFLRFSSMSLPVCLQFGATGALWQRNCIFSSPWQPLWHVRGPSSQSLCTNKTMKQHAMLVTCLCFMLRRFTLWCILCFFRLAIL